MIPADEFLRLFNELTDHLRKITGSDSTLPFAQLVDQAADKSTIVARMRGELKNYGRLRNAIVHYRDYPPEVIAEPTEKTVNRLRMLWETMRSPEKLDPTFRKPIIVFALSDPLPRALRLMRENDFSQVVVWKDSELDLLTVEGVARWLEQGLSSGPFRIDEATVGHAHRYDLQRSFLIMRRDQSIYDAEDAFAKAIETGIKRLYAIIITKSGAGTEDPIGMVTPWDLLQKRRDHQNA